METIETTTLSDRIVNHLLAGGRVMLASYTRPTIYDKRHVSMFRQNGRGVRIGWPGKRSVYADPSHIVFSQEGGR